MKAIIGDPYEIAKEINKENITMDKVIPLGCGIEPMFREYERLRCAVLIIK